MSLYIALTTICNGLSGLKSSVLPLLLYVRSKDFYGSGKADVSIDELATFLDRSVGTIRRHIRECQTEGYFRSVNRIKGCKKWVRIYYSSLTKVMASKQIDDLGAIAKIPLCDLPMLKFHLTQLATERLQGQSKYMAEKPLNKGRSKHHQRVRLPEPWQLLKQSTSDQWDGCKGLVAFQNKHLIVNDEFDGYGVNQETIAYDIGVKSTRTIQRRLGGSSRKKKGLLPILKKQVLRVVNSSNLESFMKTYGLKVYRHGENVFLLTKHGVVEPMPNIYNAEFEQLRCSQFRKRLKRSRWHLSTKKRIEALKELVDMPEIEEDLELGIPDEDYQIRDLESRYPEMMSA